MNSTAQAIRYSEGDILQMSSDDRITFSTAEQLLIRDVSIDLIKACDNSAGAASDFIRENHEATHH